MHKTNAIIHVYVYTYLYVGWKSYLQMIYLKVDAVLCLHIWVTIYFACMPRFAHVSMYIPRYISASHHVYIHACTFKQKYIQIGTRLHTSTYIYTHLHKCIHLNIIYTYIYIHTWITYWMCLFFWQYTCICMLRDACVHLDILMHIYIYIFSYLHTG